MASAPCPQCGGDRLSDMARAVTVGGIGSKFVAIAILLFTSFLFKSEGKKVSVPMFIILFVLAMVVNTYLFSRFEVGVVIGDTINLVARKLLTITLFFIGASLSIDVLKSVGLKPLLQGVLLWIVISIASLAYICLI